jgi:hypothetical protein
VRRAAATITARSYWRWRRDDFFLESSFTSWGAYRRALRETPAHLHDRLAGRSTDAVELGALRLCSEHEMRRCLTWWDLTWFGFGSVIGAGIFVLKGQEARDHEGPAIVLSYVASGLSAMLSVFCYTEFAVEIPMAGGSFAYLGVELGDAATFVAAANLILESVIGTAAVARSWTSYLALLVNRPASALRIHEPGLADADAANLRPFMPQGVPGVFQAAAIVYFAYGGFDNIATMAEETRKPSRDIPLGLLGHVAGAVAGLRGAGAGVGGRHAGNPVAGARGAGAQGVGRAARVVAALAVHRHQPLPHGLARQGRLHSLRHLHEETKWHAVTCLIRYGCPERERARGDEVVGGELVTIEGNRCVTTSVSVE